MLKIDLQLPIAPADRPATVSRRTMGFTDVVLDPMVLIVALLVVMGGIAVIVEDVTLTRTRKEQEQQLQTARQNQVLTEALIKEAEDLDRSRKTIQKTISDIRSVDQGRYGIAHLLDDAARALHSEMFLDSIAIVAFDAHTGRLKAVVAGIAPSNDAVSIYSQRLEASPFLGNVQFAQSKKLERNKQDVIRFVLTLESEQPAPGVVQTQVINPDGTVSNGAPNAGATPPPPNLAAHPAAAPAALPTPARPVPGLPTAAVVGTPRPVPPTAGSAPPAATTPATMPATKPTAPPTSKPAPPVPGPGRAPTSVFVLPTVAPSPLTPPAGASPAGASPAPPSAPAGRRPPRPVVVPGGRP